VDRVSRLDIICLARLNEHVNQTNDTVAACFVYLGNDILDRFFVNVAEQAVLIRVG
jgi:hypothetical protein